MKKIYLKEGIRLYDEDGNLWEIEDGDYTVINDEMIEGTVLNSDLIRSITDIDLQHLVLDLVKQYGENKVVESLLYYDGIYHNINLAAEDVIYEFTKFE